MVGWGVGWWDFPEEGELIFEGFWWRLWGPGFWFRFKKNFFFFWIFRIILVGWLVGWWNYCYWGEEILYYFFCSFGMEKNNLTFFHNFLPSFFSFFILGSILAICISRVCWCVCGMLFRLEIFLF